MDIRMVLAAQGLLQKWKDGEAVEELLQNSQHETLVITAASQLNSPEEQAEWITLVRGDGTDFYRNSLAEKCQQRITQRDQGLQ